MPKRQLLRGYVCWSCRTRGRVCCWWFCGEVLSGSPHLLERCRLRCRSISVNLGTAPSRTTALSLSSQQSHPPSACARSWAGLTTHRSSWHFDSSHSYRTYQRIRELLRFICGQLLLGRQAALVLNEKLVDTVGDMLVDLAHPSLHVVE